MRKQLLRFSSLLVVFSILMVSCDKEEDKVEESPLFQLLEDPAIMIDTVAQAADTWDYGFAFSPLKSGSISNLAMKLPATGAFKVTLWDLSGSSPVALHAHNINSGEVHKIYRQDVGGIRVDAGKKYGISILANTFYRVSKAGGGAFTFPRTIGNIVVHDFHEAINNSGLASFPTETNDTRVAPCVDVIFIAD
jgi:hypothetical protein